MTEPPTVSVLGTGALGAALAQALHAAQVPTILWNRSPDRLAAVADRLPGVRPAATVTDAVESAAVVVLAVADAAAAEAVLSAAGDALTGRVVVNLTSTTPEQAQLLASRFGPEYLDGAAMSGTRLIGDPTALFLYAGAAAAFSRVEDVLKVLGRARFLSEDPRDASRWDTALLGLNLGLLTAFYQAVALLGGSATQLADVATAYLPFATGLIADHARQIDAQDYPADDGTLTVYAGAVDHLIATAEQHGVGADLPLAVRTVIGRAIAQGRGDQGLAALTEALR
ncbi:6-phosphogluconate dehydrogenase NAD-binding protein [Kribbella flavida DSM 17836]|uniref:6-phosphogluconate dehydrogenase NAD-binding protein n=1 Tax=Kribbella flavida (strain DSM 17836 / JCM 10339 / NBRC 14399) TaxID=479435 RepID=D2Q0X7_KRIFD|nr:NAD(P)-binding domain-containing protein [Kribbella flavida]ADB35678.1 6-phosphogluconate dehydrogenase NAD-binding protein [Kribbella flavida DSM 17836]